MTNARPHKKEITVHGHQYCHECKKVGWNECCDAGETYLKDTRELKACECNRAGARTMRKVCEGIVQCPRCGGLVATREPKDAVRKCTCEKCTGVLIESLYDEPNDANGNSNQP